jgi:hypothetical protein
MGKHSAWVVWSFLVVALAGVAMTACGSDKTGTGTAGAALSDCDAGDACAAAPASGGW